MELNAAVLGVRLYKLIITKVDLPIQNIAFWTDSMLVLRYNQNETHRKVYIANHVTEIKEETSTHQWRHIECENNFADICSRGVKSVGELLAETHIGQKWFNGLQFLWNDEESKGNVHLGPLPETNDEIKTREFLVASVTTEELDFVKYGEWKKLCRILAYVKRFHTNCKGNSKKLKGFLSADELKVPKLQLLTTFTNSSFMQNLIL